MKYARVRNSDKKILEFRDHPDGHVDTLSIKFGPSFEESWLPVETLVDETPTNTQRLVPKYKVLVDKVTEQKVTQDLSVTEVKSKDAVTEGNKHLAEMSTLFASMKDGIPATAEEQRKINLFMLSRAGVTE